MEWLSGLSNIKGQISTITKDLLAEGSAELSGKTMLLYSRNPFSDPTAELEMATNRISELQSIIDAQKEEITTLTTKNDELGVQLESHEMRLSHAKEQFRIQLAAKEALITKLRKEMSVERGEPEGQSAPKSDDNAPSSMDDLTDLASEDFRTSDKSNQEGTATWNELRNEVAHLRKEVSKWRGIAKQRKSNAESLVLSEEKTLDTTELEKEIEELKHRLLVSEETRQDEMSVLKDSHMDHLNNLVEQLRETEAEVLSLQNQLDRRTSQSTCDAAETPELSSTPVLEQQKPVPEQEKAVLEPEKPAQEKIGKKRQRNLRKKKGKQTAALEAEVVPCTPEVELTSEAVSPIKEFTDFATQTEHCDSSTETSVDYERVDLPTISTPTSSDVQSTPSPVGEVLQQTCGVQAQPSTCTMEVQTDEYCSTTTPMATQTDFSTPPSPSVLHVAEAVHPSPHFYPLPGSDRDDEHQSQVSDVSELSTYSRQLDDIIHQLSEEMQTYEHTVDAMVSTVMSGNESVDDANHLEQTATTGQLGTPASEETEQLAEKLSRLQASLKARREQLALLRQTDRKHRKRSGLSRNLSSTPGRSRDASDTYSPVIMTPTDAPVTEHDTEGWQDDDFPELVPESTGGSSNEKEADDSEWVHHHGDDKKTQTLRRSESNETIICDLRNTVSDLQARLAEETDLSSSRIHDLQTNLEPMQRLCDLLDSSVSELAARFHAAPPSPLCDGRLDWPPKNPEAQLGLLISAERFACAEMQRLHVAMNGSQELIHQLTNENQRLLLQTEECLDTEAGEDQVIDHDAEEEEDQPAGVGNEAELARRLCVILDTEWVDSNWDDEQWDVLLYELLKPRFVSDEANSSLTDDERVIKLSAELAVLRDLLDQHAAFRAQAEQDLRQLFASVSNQQEQIRLLTVENEHLKHIHHPDAVAVEPSINLRQVDSDDLSREAIQKLSELVRSKEEEVEVLQRRCDDLKDLIRSAHRQLGQSGDGIQPSGETHSEEGDVASVLERLTTKWSEAKARAERAEAMHDSLVSALQQKHTESQTYHAEVQRIYSELLASEERNQQLHGDVTSLREQLTQTLEAQRQSLVRQASISDPHRSTMAPDAARLITCESSELTGAAMPGRNETKLTEELVRLRTHLLEMEQTYTTEALNSESREVHLRNQLHEKETRLSQLLQSGRTAEDRVKRALAERDEAMQSCDDHRKEAVALSASLANLQSVLDSFQQNQQSTITAETEHIRLELQRVLQRESEAQTQVERMHERLRDGENWETHSHELENQLKRQVTQLSRMHNQSESARTFTQLLISFLDQEAGPGSQLRLPMDHYTPESVRPSHAPPNSTVSSSHQSDSIDQPMGDSPWEEHQEVQPTIAGMMRSTESEPRPTKITNPLFSL